VAVKTLESGSIPVWEAVEWREAAPGGTSRSQIFRLADGRFAVVKFPENPQGERVLINELLCCNLAEHFNLPVNRARLIAIDERSIRAARQSGHIPADFSAGIRCGMIRFEQNEICQPADILSHCDNATDLHSVLVFEQLVGRGDGRQLLMYPSPDGPRKRFAAFDYGFAFGASPTWSLDTLKAFPAPKLPNESPFDQKQYKDGAEMQPFINSLRTLVMSEVEESLMALYPPRWGATLQEVQSLLQVIETRASALVTEFDERYDQQMEMPDNVHH
jgi:hypothetical protein